MSLYSMIQATVAGAEPQLSQLLTGAAVTIIVSLQGWVIRSMSQVRDEVKMLRQHVFGPSGNGGLSAEVEDVQDDLTQVTVRVNVHDVQLAQHDAKINMLSKSK